MKYCTIYEEMNKRRYYDRNVILRQTHLMAKERDDDVVIHNASLGFSWMTCSIGGDDKTNVQNQSVIKPMTEDSH